MFLFHFLIEWVVDLEVKSPLTWSPHMYTAIFAIFYTFSTRESLTYMLVVINSKLPPPPPKKKKIQMKGK